MQVKVSLHIHSLASNIGKYISSVFLYLHIYLRSEKLHIMIHKFLQSKVGLWIRRKLEYKNNKLENIHDGESCYIFGDGHSIKYYDISNFNDKIGIACNHFPFHKDLKKRVGLPFKCPVFRSLCAEKNSARSSRSQYLRRYNPVYGE